MFISSSKVKFQDQQLDDYVLENSVLRSKLQSKIDALSIMNKELDKCNMERDKYKVLVEQLKCKNAMPQNDHSRERNISRFMPMNTITGSEMLAKTRDQNNMLKLEVETLRSKLEEAMGDVVVLRKELQKKDRIIEVADGIEQTSTNLAFSNIDNEKLVQDLEKFQSKYQQVQLDYRALLEEKEELVCDRDYYKNKVQRLNHQISYILSNRVKTQQSEKEKSDPPKPIVDIDALVMENKYLHERITQLQVEKEIIKRTLTKYKTLLENRNNGDSINMKKGFPDVMTQKQVRNFLDINTKTVSNRTSVLELKSLCLGLFEALNDKSTALQHQRKTNQILANRITELEKTMESWCNGEKYVPIFPAQMLLDEFLPEVDTVQPDMDILRNKNIKDNMSKKNKLCDGEEDMNNDNSIYSLGNMDGYDLEKKQSKTVLPVELEKLVKEALQELRPDVN